MEMNKELLAKAKNVKSEEELLALAKEHNVEMTEESAKAYFEFLQAQTKTGELSDEELDNVAGGGCHRDDGRLVVTPTNGCEHWICEIHQCATGHDWCAVSTCSYGLRSNGKVGSPSAGHCSSCYYSVYEDALLLCNHPANKG